MKKIFTLAIALIAFASVASAQVKTMKVNTADGSTKSYATAQVESVTFGEDTWEYVGTGTYTSQKMAITLPQTWTVDLYRSTEDATKYKIDDWRYVGYPFYFTLSSDNSMQIETDCDTGVETTSSSGWTGHIFVAEANVFTAWFSSMSTVDYNSYYDESSGTYYFAIAYYMWTNAAQTSATYWAYSGYVSSSGTSYGYETLTITSPAGAPAKKPEIAEPVGVASK